MIDIFNTYCVPRPWWVIVLFFIGIICSLCLLHWYLRCCCTAQTTSCLKKKWYDTVPKRSKESVWLLLLCYMLVPTVLLICLWNSGAISNSTYYPWVFFLWPLIVIVIWILNPRLVTAVTDLLAAASSISTPLNLVAFVIYWIFLSFIGGMLVCGIRML